MTLHPFSPAERAFETYVIAHLKDFAGVIDVTRFINCHRWGKEKIMDLYIEVLWNNPEIFYVTKSIRYEAASYPDGTVQFAKLTGIRYAFPQTEYPQNKRRLDAAVRRATACAAGESAPEMIALRLHDFIVRECEYDLAAAEADDFSPLARTAYSVLVRRKAVCEGYTMAYRYLLQKFSIMCEEIVSDTMHHCWNYVNIRGKWYHVDVTFDDPVFVDEAGRPFPAASSPSEISRRHFLMSDAEARRTGHRGWTTKGLPPALDRTYDDKDWR